MGTNYYYYEKYGSATKEDDDGSLHIGKSSGGWTFALHAIPELGLITFEDWLLHMKPKGYIVDEYGDEVSFEELYDIVINRGTLFNGRPLLRQSSHSTIVYSAPTYESMATEFR